MAKEKRMTLPPSRSPSKTSSRRGGWRRTGRPCAARTAAAPCSRPASPALDELLHGGLPRGHVSEIHGPASSGRTGLALAMSRGRPRRARWWRGWIPATGSTRFGRGGGGRPRRGCCGCAADGGRERGRSARASRRSAPRWARASSSAVVAGPGRRARGRRAAAPAGRDVDPPAAPARGQPGALLLLADAHVAYGPRRRLARARARAARNGRGAGPGPAAARPLRRGARGPRSLARGRRRAAGGVWTEARCSGPCTRAAGGRWRVLLEVARDVHAAGRGARRAGRGARPARARPRVAGARKRWARRCSSPRASARRASPPRSPGRAWPRSWPRGAAPA